MIDRINLMSGFVQKKVNETEGLIMLMNDKLAENPSKEAGKSLINAIESVEEAKKHLDIANEFLSEMYGILTVEAENE
jgi:hypothetical protein